MTASSPSNENRTYRAWLRSRWPRRARVLGLYAIAGSFGLLAFDLAFVLPRPDAPRAAVVAALRLPWIALPLLGMWAAAAHPTARLLPPTIVALGVAWTWANDWVYCQLGLAGSTLQALALVVCVLTAAIFLPLGPPARLAVFGVMWLGHLALDLAWPQAGARAPRLFTDGAILVVVVCLTVLFEQFVASQRRGLVLRRRLERAVLALEASRARADEATAAVVRLASEVAHEVNNPLAAVRSNVQWLGRAARDGDPEHREATEETLEALDRIARIVTELRRHALEMQPDAPPGVAAAPGHGPAPQAARLAVPRRG